MGRGATVAVFAAAVEMAYGFRIPWHMPVQAGTMHSHRRVARGSRARVAAAVDDGDSARTPSHHAPSGESIDQLVAKIEARAMAKKLRYVAVCLPARMREPRLNAADSHDRRFFAEDPSTHFRSIDADGSGEITFDEWEASFGCDEVFSPHLRVLFDQLDSNADGRVSYAEFIAAVQCYLGAPWMRETRNKIEDARESAAVAFDRSFQEGTILGTVLSLYLQIKMYIKAVDWGQILGIFH